MNCSEKKSQLYFATKRIDATCHMCPISWHLVVIMAGSVKLFQFFQKFQRILGIYPSQSGRKQRSMILRRTVYLIGISQLFFSTAAYLVLEADSVYQYGFGFCISITLFTCITVYLLFVWQLENTVDFIKHCEEFIATSKCESIKSHRTFL